LGHEADYLEIDLWVHRGRFEARHERRLPFHLPGIYERWYLHRPPADRDPLGTILHACEEHTGLLLDIKNGNHLPSTMVARALAKWEQTAAVAASSQHWPALRAIARAAPAVAVYYSVDVVAKLDLLFSVARRDPLPAGISCRHSLLTREVVERLHDEGLAVIAWTVDNEKRAVQLAEMGVDAITTHRVRELRAEIGGP
jgi:glycerophosphoryl diester phosphodiesterase